MQNLRKNEIVFLGYTVSTGITTPRLKDHIKNLANAIRARGAHLVIFDDVYATSFEPEDCSPTIPMLLGVTHKKSACNFSVQSASNYKELMDFDYAMNDLQKKDSIIYIATRNWICPNGMCFYKQPKGMETYDYGSHLFKKTSASFGFLLRKELHSRNILSPS